MTIQLRLSRTMCLTVQGVGGKSDNSMTETEPSLHKQFAENLHGL
jgi:hypothetical protein